MYVLTIRTDNPDAEIGLFDDNQQLSYITWKAHKQLAESINKKIEEMLTAQHCSYSLLGGVICFKGPGSFTGLRIGMSVGNAIAYGLHIPIVSQMGEDWIQDGLQAIKTGGNETIAMPEYGAPVHITVPKK